jgi:hypothetical protein
MTIIIIAIFQYQKSPRGKISSSFNFKNEMINTEDTWEEAVREYLGASKYYSRMKKIRWIKANMSGVASQVVYGETFRKVAKFLHFRKISKECNYNG